MKKARLSDVSSNPLQSRGFLNIILFLSDIEPEEWEEGQINKVHGEPFDCLTNW